MKSEWGENIPECKLESQGDNIWHYTIKGGPRAFYGVEEGETITHLAFVFRSADSTLEIKDNGADIFIEMAKEGMSVRFLTPAHGDILQVGDECNVQVQQQAATTVSLYKNDEKVAESGQATITYTFTPDKAEDIVLRAVATDGTTTIEESIKLAVLGETVTEARPAGVDNGVNINGDEVTFVLFAPGKNSVVLLGPPMCSTL